MPNIKMGTPRSAEDRAKIGLLAVCGVEYGTSGYATDLHYYQGGESIRKAKILAKSMSKEAGENLIELVMQSNLKMEESSHGGYRINSGRKKELPDGARTHSILATDEEFEKLKSCLQQIREKSGAQSEIL